MRYIYIILSIMVLLYGFGKALDVDRDHSLLYIRYGLRRNDKILLDAKQQLQECHRKTGHYPSNDERLLFIAGQIKSKSEPDDSSYWTYGRKLCSPWGDPLIYENRRGLAESKFADSGATIDTKRHYSIEVDKGIYLWSLGAQQHYETYAIWKPKVDLIRIFSSIIAIILVGLSVRLSIRDKQFTSWSDKIFGVIWSIIAGLVISIIPAALFIPMYAKTCYEGGLSWYRRPELTKDYLELIDRYHNNGVIGDDAYKKIVDTMNNADPHF